MKNLKVSSHLKGAELFLEFDGHLLEQAKDELINLTRFRNESVTMDFENLEFVGSTGTKLWLTFITEFSDGREIRFRNCSPAIVQQIAMIDKFRANATVESVYVPYFCESCEVTTNHLLKCRSSSQDPEITSLPAKECPECEAPLEIDDDVKGYLALVNEVPENQAT